MPSPSTRYTCPHCQQRVKGPTSSAGKSVNCPNCGKRFILVPTDEEPDRPPPIIRPALPPSTARGSPEPPAPPVFVPATRPSGASADRLVERRTARRDDEGEDDDRPPRRIQVEHRARGSFGTGLKLTLGILTAVGLVVVGLVLVFCILPVVGMGVVGGRAANAVAEASEKQRQADAKAMTVVDQKTGKSAVAATATEGEPPRAGLRQAAVIGDVEVSISEVIAGRVPLERLGDGGESESRLLRLVIRVQTRNETQKVDYRSWQAGFLSSAKCVDNFGNRYKGIDFGFATKVVGHVASASVSAGRPASDVLVFELPIPKTEYIDIDLDGENVGERSSFRFRVPASAWAAKR